MPKPKTEPLIGSTTDNRTNAKLLGEEEVDALADGRLCPTCLAQRDESGQCENGHRTTKEAP